MLRLITLLLLTPLVLAQENRYNPFRGKEMPFIPYRDEPEFARIKYFQLCEKQWTMSEQSYQDFFDIAIKSEHSAKSIEALVKVLETQTHPRNSELIILVLSNAKIEDQKLRSRFLKVLADCFYDQEAWQRALVVAGTKDNRLDVIDEASIRFPMPRRAWWLSERFVKHMLLPIHYPAAFVIIGREGSNFDHEVVKLATFPGFWADKYHRLAREGLEAGINQRSGQETEIGNTLSRPRLALFDPDRRPRDLNSFVAATEDFSAVQDLLSDRNDDRVLEALRRLIRANQIPKPSALTLVILDSTREEKLRIEALAAKAASDEKFSICMNLLRSEKTGKALRLVALTVIIDSKPTKLLDLIALQDMLHSAKEDEQKLFAIALAATQEGANLLLASAQAGKIPATILRDTAVLEKLKAVNVYNLDERLKNLPK